MIAATAMPRKVFQGPAGGAVVKRAAGEIFERLPQRKVRVPCAAARLHVR